jgi:uncharacterized protein (TIGR03067 family)
VPPAGAGRACAAWPLCWLLPGPGAGDDADKDLRKLAGTWEEVSHTADGKAKSADEVRGHPVMVDAAGKWEAFQDGTSLLKATIKLDPDKKPRAADWAIDGSDMVARGVYEVDGDTQKYCFSLADRPAEFESKQGSGVFYIVLMRVKK